MTIALPDINNYKDSDYKVATQMLHSLFHRFCNNKGTTSAPYWMDKFSSHTEANKMLIKLARDNWITMSIPKNNWAEIGINKEKLLDEYTEKELKELIIQTKLDRYAPNNHTPISLIEGATSVKLPSGVQRTGLIRTGFAKASKHEFKYDISMMKKYYKPLVQYSIKAMKKMEKQLGYSLVVKDGYDYESIIRLVIDNIIANEDQSYTVGKLTLDSRGRAIYDCVKKVFNPISNKIARALVIAPETTPTKAGIGNAYLFIAELTEGFTPNIPNKRKLGRKAYLNRKFHQLDLTTTKGRDNLFENIWLERLYNDLDAYYADKTHKITTPIEVDFSASNMTINGLLLGHSDYVNHTKYMWEIDGLTKNHVKFAQTPYVFGSQAPVSKLWKKNNLDFTEEQIAVMRKEQLTGKFAIANEFKDILINHCKLKDKMQLHVGREKFMVECNRYKNVGDITKQYLVYNSNTKRLVPIKHTRTHKIPDLEQFRRYTPTGLVHNVDSQIEDRIVSALLWCISIHDACIVTWNEATTMRNVAVEQMKYVRDNRDTIVEDYLKSINLTDKGWKAYSKLKTKIAKLNKGKRLTISPYLLK